MKKLILIALLLWSSSAFGAVLNAPNCERATLITYISDASDGDTIILPAGTCDWTGGVTINNKELYIKGAGAGSTVINYTRSGSSNAFTVVNNTKAFSIGNMTLIGNTGPLFNIYRTSNQTNVSEGWSVYGMNIQLVGNTGGHVFIVLGYQAGVVYNNTIRRHNNGTGSCSGTTNIFYVEGREGEANSSIDTLLGSNSWRRAVGHGASGKVYIEGNTLSMEDSCYGNTIDGTAGARWVYRYNTVSTTGYAIPIECHGACTSGYRSVFGGEIYNNDLTMPTLGQPGSYNPHIKKRGGTWLLYNNKFRGGGGAASYILVDSQRSSSSEYPYCQSTLRYHCNGDATFDGNTAPKATYMGYPCLDQIGRGTGDSGEQISSPVYSWGNIRHSDGAARNAIALNNIGGTNPAQADHLKKDRDWYEGSAPDGYTPYTCPHPLAGSGSCDDEVQGIAGYTLGDDPVGDETPPTLSSAIVNSAGTSLTLYFSENVVATINTGFTVTPSGGAATLTYASGSGSSTLVYTISRAIQQAETLTGAYTQPGDGIEDASGNDLATIESFNITNQSTQAEPPLRELTVTMTGSGVATSSPSGIICGTDCTEEYENGTTVTLSGYCFPGWKGPYVTGDCASNGTVSMDGAKTCTVTCTPIQQMLWSR